jgi:hypothetical protein
MFSLPDAGAHPTTLADWFEFMALSSPACKVPFAELVSGNAIAEDEEPEDWSDADVLNESLIASVQSELQDRRQVIGDDYPFRIDEQGNCLHFNLPLTTVGSVYLFCLFLSHAQDRTILPKHLAPELTNPVRDLFQACSTVAAAGYVQGVAVSFGWPRPDRSTFAEALKKTYADFGDGKPLDRPRPAAPAHIQDGGIDIIAWKPAVDRLPGTHYMLGQVASGQNWRQKSVRNDSKLFHEYWFERRPAAQHEDAIFIPFCLEPTGASPDATPQEVLVDHMQALTIQFGTVFYRYRIPRCAAEGLNVDASGRYRIERVADLVKIEVWVDDYWRTLCNKRAQ